MHSGSANGRSGLSVAHGAWRTLEEFRLAYHVCALFVFLNSLSAKDSLMGHMSRTCELLSKGGAC